MTTVTSRPLPGGPVAVDLLNTSWGVAPSEVDWLDSDDAVKAFSASYDLPAADSDLPAIRASLVQARGLIERLFQQAGDGEVDEQTTADINELLAAAALTLTNTDEGPKLVAASSDPKTSLAIDALINALDLAEHQASRVRSCAHDQCVLWFHDTSKAGRRRWCSMDLCGNRAKAQRHYARSTGRD